MATRIADRYREWEAECAVLRGEIIRSLDKICTKDA